MPIRKEKPMQLFEGDCIEVMKEIPAANVDMVFCDLPYGVTARNPWDAVIPFASLWAAYGRIVKENGAMVFTATQPFASALVMSKPDWFKYEWIWEKTKTTGFLNAKKQPLRNHEQVLVFYRKQPIYNPQGVKECNIQCDRGSEEGVGTNYNTANPVYTQTQTGYPRSVQKFASEGKTVHPTQKPLSLVDYLVRTYTISGETVLDNCMGSGTTGVACANNGRKFIGIEQDAKYFQIAKSRIDEALAEYEFFGEK
jgi:site-specific DNA-methyltransferase (adenine-specific)